MLSRASILTGQQSKILTALAARTTQTSAQTPAQAASVSACDAAGGAGAGAGDGGRDLKNFPRIVRSELPGKVRLGFIPDEWFQFFYKKTGVTGPYAFGIGLTTYLCSKEIYVMEHEYYTGLSIAVMAYYTVKHIGPIVADFADKEIETYENSWKIGRESEIAALNTAIKEEEKSQWQADGQLLLMDAKRENILLQLEAAYRARLMTAYTEVKRRLDYQIEKVNIENRIAQKHMIAWIIKQVTNSITSDQDKATVNKCIEDLGALIPKA